MPVYVEQLIVEGSTVNFIVYVQKDGAVWDITGATVRLYLKSPKTGWISPYTATVTDGPAGKASYQTTSTVLNAAGDWLRQWYVEKSGVVQKSEPVAFSVLPFAR